jgi:shikimate kinase
VLAAGKHRYKPRAVFLLGFMGAGKSSVGRSMAEQLGWPFEDLDERIEKRERRKVHQIFRESGEIGFRAAEQAALGELLSEVRAGARKIVALGGGAFVQKENARLIEEAGLATVFLDASADELWRRCRNQADRDGVERPLLGSLSNFRHLYKKRRPHYARAIFHQATEGKTVHEIAGELVEAIGISSGGSSSCGSSSRKSSSNRSRRTGPKREILQQREQGGNN